MNLKLFVFLLLVSCAFSGIVDTDKNDNEENKKENVGGDSDENDHEASFCIMDENDNEASKRETESTDKMVQLEENAENLPNEIQEIQQKNLKKKDENLQSDEKIDAQSILKKFKIQETFYKTWTSAFNAYAELDVAENCLGFQFKAGGFSPNYPKRRTVLWESEALGKNFPLSFSHKGNTYKLKSCNAGFQVKYSPYRHENQITIVYGNESPIWHATFPKYLKSFVFSDSDTISLILTQEQPVEKPKPTPAVGKLLLNTLESEGTDKKEIEANQNPIYISVRHNNVEISNQLQNLLENSTKLDFENLKKLWAEIDTTNLAKIVAREKKRTMIVSVGVPSVLGVPLFSFVYKILTNELAFWEQFFSFYYEQALIDYYGCLFASSIFGTILALILGVLLNVKLRSKTLQKFTKY